jgi:hypothetical protein
VATLAVSMSLTFLSPISLPVSALAKRMRVLIRGLAAGMNGMERR